MSNAKKPRGLREVLRKRQVMVTYYDLPLVEYSVAAEHKKALNQATTTLTAGQFLLEREPDRDDVKAAVARAELEVGEARKALEGCFHRIAFKGLKGEDFDALVQLHPPTEEGLQAAQEAGEDLPMWDDATFYPALLEHSAQESELTAEEWAEELETWTRGERKEIQAKVLEASIRSYSAGLAHFG